LALGYRLEADGVTVAYSCDHEPHTPQLAAGHGEVTEEERRHADFLRGADLAIHDAQYTAAEYAAKQGWGHSTIEYVVDLGRRARVRRLALTHHDPMRSDDALDELIAEVQRGPTASETGMEVFGAREGQELELRAEPHSIPPHKADEVNAADSMDSAVISGPVLLGIADPVTAKTLLDGIEANGIHAVLERDAAAVIKRAKAQTPALVIVERQLPGLDGLEVCRRLRASGLPLDLPLIVVADAPGEVVPEGSGVSDWLIKPFSNLYARSRVRSWLLRTALRWVPAALPPDEEARLASLRALNILDTPAEPDFDEVTREAANSLDVPVVLLSLIDRDRQWFKSAHGTTVRETPRDLSFCAHAVANKAPMMVCDTLQDPRFNATVQRSVAIVDTSSRTSASANAGDLTEFSFAGALIANHTSGPYLRLAFGTFVVALGIYLMFGAFRRLGWV